MSDHSRWWSGGQRKPSTSIRLFCFPYAGGNASTFREWTALLPASIEVCSLHLPGRERRLMEPAYVQMANLIPVLATAMEKEWDQPYAFFGHSMGALIAFALAKHLREQGKPEPLHLFLSARRPPHLPPRLPPLHALPTDDFIAALQSFGGMHPEIVENSELLQLLLPTLRADFQLVETYRENTVPSVTCPITALVGDQDPRARSDEVSEWADQTTGPFQLISLPGRHFYINDPDVRASLGRKIAQTLFQI